MLKPSAFQSGAARSAAAFLVAAIVACALPAAAQKADPAPSAPPRPTGPIWFYFPGWVTPPQPEFPPQALAINLADGRAEIDCAVQMDGALTDCRVAFESHPGLGLGEAALAAAPQGRVPERSYRNDGREVRTTYVARFRAPAPSVRIETHAPPVIVPGPPVPVAPRPAQPTPPRPSLITNVTWARAPQAEFPERARTAGLRSGAVGAACTMNPNGSLTDCRVLHEERPNLGFGAAALAALRRARVSPRTVDSAAEGARVLLWIPVVEQ